MKKALLKGLVVVSTMGSLVLPCFRVVANAETIEKGQYGRPYFVDGVDDYICDSPEQIRDEIMYGEWEEASQLIQAEAGNQSLLGKRLVADVLFNRIESGKFGDDMHDVIFAKNPIQFSVTVNGAYKKAAWNMEDSDFKAVEMEADPKTRLNSEVLYFNCGDYIPGTTPLFKEGDHYFSK